MVKWFIFIFLICLMVGGVIVFFKHLVRIKDGYIGYIIGKNLSNPKVLMPGDFTVVIPFLQQFYTIKNCEYEVKIPPNENHVENKEETQGMDARFFRCKDNDYVRIQFFVKFRIDLNEVVKDNVYRFKYSNEDSEVITHDVYMIVRHYIDTTISGISRHEALHREDWKKALEAKIREALKKRFLILTEFGTYGKNKHDPFSQAEFRTHQELENLENQARVAEKSHQNIIAQQDLRSKEVLDEIEKQKRETQARASAELENAVALAELKKTSKDLIIEGLKADTEQQIEELNAKTKIEETLALYETARQETERLRAEIAKQERIIKLDVESAMADIGIKKESAHTESQVKIIEATGEALKNLKPDSWNVVGGSADSGFNMVAGALKMLEYCKSDGFMDSEICDTWSQRILGSAYNVDQKDIQIRTQPKNKSGSNSDVREYVNRMWISNCVPNISESDIDDIQLSEEDSVFGDVLYTIAKEINKVLGWDNMVSCVNQVIASKK